MSAQSASSEPDKNCPQGNAPIRSTLLRSQEYEDWVKDVGVVAPKVRVAGLESSKHERGLFSTETILPGERIMFVPSSALIGEKMIQTRGSDLLAAGKTRCSGGAGHNNTIIQEQAALRFIEELRRQIIVAEEDDSSSFAATVRKTGYEWRGDDAVALFLVACQKLLELGMQRGDADEGGEQPSTNSMPVETAVVQAGVRIQDISDGCSNRIVVNGEKIDIEGTPVATVLSDNCDGADENVKIPSFLLHVRMLPASFPTSPLYYTPEELDRLLDGTNCHGFVTRMLQQIESDWAKLHALITEYYTEANNSDESKADGKECTLQPDDFTLDAYKWALSNVYSRCTDLFRKDESSEEDGPLQHYRVMVPLFDMMNHDCSEVSHSMDEEGNISVFNSESRTIPSGAEIKLNYGSFPNEKLLLVYGFTVPNNPFDAVQIYAPINPSDPLFQVKSRVLWSRCGIEDPNAPHLLLAANSASGHILPSSLLSALRLIGIQSAEDLLSIAAQDLDSSDDEGGDGGDGNGNSGVGMINRENEEASLTALGSALDSMARRLALNLISDEGLKAASAPLQVLDLERIQEEDGGEAENVDGMSNQPEMRAGTLGDTRTTLQETVQNCATLCQSEFRTLQAALAEINERKEKLRHLEVGFQ